MFFVDKSFDYAGIDLAGIDGGQSGHRLRFAADRVKRLRQLIIDGQDSAVLQRQADVDTIRQTVAVLIRLRRAQYRGHQLVARSDFTQAHGQRAHGSRVGRTGRIRQDKGQLRQIAGAHIGIRESGNVSRHLIGCGWESDLCIADHRQPGTVVIILCAIILVIAEIIRKLNGRLDGQVIDPGGKETQR